MRPRPPRFDYQTLLVFTPLEGGEAFTARSVNLCEGGMLVRTDGALATGDVLRFAASTFDGTCEVMWAHEAEDGSTLFGIRFADLAAPAKQELARLLYDVTERQS